MTWFLGLFLLGLVVIFMLLWVLRNDAGSDEAATQRAHDRYVDRAEVVTRVIDPSKVRPAPSETAP